jgi:hypothetical protein
LGILDPNPHHTKPTRHARKLINRMLRTGVVPQHASVLHAQAEALVHETHRRDKGRRSNPLPGEPKLAPGQRVRLGPENRALLRRLRDARNLREMQALAREVQHRIRKAIRAAERRRKLREQAARRARGARDWFTGRARNAWERALPQRDKRETPAAPKRDSPAAAPSRGTPASRTRFGTVPQRASRSRFGTPARTRRRGRPAWSRSRAS